MSQAVKIAIFLLWLVVAVEASAQTGYQEVQFTQAGTISGTVKWSGPLPHIPSFPIDKHFVAAIAVPLRNNAEGDRPVRRILPDRSIPIVHQLVAVVLKLLAKVVEHRPSFVAGGAAQAIFPGKGREGMRVANGKEEEEGRQ